MSVGDLLSHDLKLSLQPLLFNSIGLVVSYRTA